jgi:nitrogen fixation/metabolism regulation signal transduction histidine kinase
MVFVSVAAVVTLLLQLLSNPFRPVGEQMRELWWTHGPFLMVMVFLLPVFVIDTIKLSHRFAGPILSLRRAMHDITEGRPPAKLKFRHDDFWREIADDFNAMIDQLAPSGERDSSTAEDEAPVASRK